ncbi:MAG TPA: transposase [Candidatus Limenecus avicola]|uniref:Transposase n=1 Tax=Candidatus Limenecus avicola TaxID=2840847 RepID=A0A9D1N0I0_9CLOT|nr:transposase [Candidatus Limenecus avicola]
MDEFIGINEIARIKGLKSTRSIRLAINQGKYIAREVEVRGGKSYEILYSSLEQDIQDRLDEEELKTTAIVPFENKVNFVSENARLTALARVDIVTALYNIRKKYSTKKEADSVFLDLYNSGIYLPQIYKFVGSISIGTLHRWVKAFEDYGTEGLLQKRKTNQQGEYNTILNEEMKQIFLKYLLHPNKFSIGKAINLTKYILEKRGYENIPCNLTFRRFAENFKKNNYSKWILSREGEKAYHDKIEPYIERDISKIEVGDVLIADGHVLNFQIINPFTGKPTRATLVGFLDWKSTALVGYEIMMSENTQCIASALRNSILNLGLIPKVVYQDNGKAFKAKYFQNIDFDEAGFNGIYAKLGIKSVFAKPYNARAKVIERFFLEFQEEFEKMMTSYIGTSIEDKPAWLKRGEKLHRDMHKKLTKNYIPTVQETIKFIDCWLEFHNSKPCPNDRSKTIQEMLNEISKNKIDKNILNDLMMKTEARTINKHGITFLGMHYRSDYLLDLREKVFIKYSLFDLSNVLVYSMKGEFLCIARQVEKVHPMANHLGTVKDIEQFKQQIQKQQRRFNRVKKEFVKYFPKEKAEAIDIEPEVVIEIEKFEQPKTPLKRKLNFREQQMNIPVFNADYEKYEWLMKYGCTNPEQRKWLERYLNSDEYNNLYGA